MKTICLVCRRVAFLTRGCCQSCYAKHRRDVRLGRTSWASLEAAGAAAPPLARGKSEEGMT